MLNALAKQVIAIGVAVLVVAGGYWYVSSLRADLVAAKKSVATLEAAVNTQHETLRRLQNDIAAAQAAHRAVAEVVANNQKSVSELQTRFAQSASGRPRDLGNLAVARPKSIERIVNNASAAAARCVELASGAKLTDAERAATKLSEINTLCPSLANPNYVAK